jgi:hypothetical protein
VSIQPETSATVRVSVPSGTRKTLRLLAGRAISVRALLVTSGADGSARSLTRSFPLRVPR